MNILINAHYNLVGEVSPAELGRALLWYVAERLDLEHWLDMTTDGVHVIVDGKAVCTYDDMVSLVEAANILIATNE